jgi:hypothetical protein
MVADVSRIAFVCVCVDECLFFKWCSDWSRMTTIAGTDRPSVLDAVVYVQRCCLSEVWVAGSRRKKRDATGSITL